MGQLLSSHPPWRLKPTASPKTRAWRTRRLQPGLWEARGCDVIRPALFSRRRLVLVEEASKFIPEQNQCCPGDRDTREVAFCQHSLLFHWVSWVNHPVNQQLTRFFIKNYLLIIANRFGSCNMSAWFTRFDYTSAKTTAGKESMREGRRVQTWTSTTANFIPTVTVLIQTYLLHLYIPNTFERLKSKPLHSLKRRELRNKCRVKGN